MWTLNLEKNSNSPTIARETERYLRSKEKEEESRDDRITSFHTKQDCEIAQSRVQSV